MNNKNNFAQSNKLISGFNQYSNSQKNIPYTNNNMLINNPQFLDSIQSPQFFNKINMMKMEQISKIKSINNLNMSINQLAQYIINPYKVEKIAKNELLEKYDNLQNTYITSKKEAPKALQEWWNNRTNNPYKNIMKHENYKKNFKTGEDLIVHKVSQLDKDKQHLIEEYEKLTNLLKIHDNELEIIYSASKQSEYKKEYDYITKFKYRIKYDPKDYNELKKFYKSEDKKLNREAKRIDEMIELLLMSDDITKEDISELQKERNINDVAKNIQIDTTPNTNDESDNDSDKQHKKIKITKKETTQQNKSDNASDKQPKKIKITKVEPQVETKSAEPIKISDEDMQKYKKKKKIQQT